MMNMDEYEHMSTVGDFEVVPADEIDLEEWQAIEEANAQKFDEFGAPIRPVVKVIDGVRDSSRR